LTDTELGKLVNAAFDEIGFADTIRERLRTAVAVVIGHGAGNAGVRQGLMAADELATTLVGRGQEVHRARASRRSSPRGVKDESATPDDVEQRAAAFRAMAGVRV